MIAGRLYPYLAVVARARRIVLLAVGGMPDHLHLLISTPPTLSTSRAIQWLKGSSSQWIQETFPEQQGFGWQRGFGAFSIGVSEFKRTAEFIENQDKHHRRKSFDEEYSGIIRKNALDYDERGLIECRSVK